MSIVLRPVALPDAPIIMYIKGADQTIMGLLRDPKSPEAQMTQDVVDEFARDGTV